MSLLPVIGSIGSSLIGGLFGKSKDKEASRENRRAREYDREVRADNKQFQIDMRNQAQDYARKTTVSDRRYAQSVLADGRDYDRRALRLDRQYAENLTAKDRRYAADLTASDRAYLDNRRDQDVLQYQNDRNFMQNRSNNLIDKSAATRGIDFTRMRDDAVAAGYNPMTALQFASAYSTARDYQLQGGVYSPGASYTQSSNVGGRVGVDGVGTTASSGGGGGGAVMPSSAPAAGGFAINGNGYTAQQSPGLSSGAWITEALDRGLDSWFSRPDPAEDKLATALRSALAFKDQKQVADSQNYRKSFGYDLTKQRPFRPSVSVGVAPMRQNQKQVLSPSDEIVAPSTRPMKVAGGNFHPSGKWSDAAAAEDRYGDLLGSAYGVGSLMQDAGYNAGRYIGEKLMWRKIRNMKQDVPVSSDIRDYAQYGVTGKRQFRLPGHPYDRRFDYRGPKLTRGLGGGW